MIPLRTEINTSPRWGLTISMREIDQDIIGILAYPRTGHLHTNRLSPCLADAPRMLDRCLLHDRMLVLLPYFILRRLCGLLPALVRIDLLVGRIPCQ